MWPGLLRIITDQKNNSNDNYYPQCGLITKSIRRIISDHTNNSDNSSVWADHQVFEGIVSDQKNNFDNKYYPQCGLITKSDAERLCSHLLDKSPPR